MIHHRLIIRLHRFHHILDFPRKQRVDLIPIKSLEKRQKSLVLLV